MAVLITTKEYIVLLQSRLMTLHHASNLATEPTTKRDIEKEMNEIRMKLSKYHAVSANGEFEELIDIANMAQN